MNRSRRALLAVPLAFGLAGCLYAQTKEAPQPAPAAQGEAAFTVDELLDKMEAARQSLKTFRADVVKVTRIEALEQTETSKGTIQFKMPRLLRLDLRNVQDGKETIYIVGTEYGWIYEPWKKQAQRGKLRDLEREAKAANPLEYGLAKDIHGLREAYTLKLLPAEQVNGRETIPLELTPSGTATYAHGKLIFWIDPKTWLPVQVREFKSNNEIIETHTFDKLETNVSIPDRTFDFKPPKDVEIIYLDETIEVRPKGK